MKILYITGSDYSALQFENQYKDTSVSEIIDMVEGELLVYDEDHGLEGEEYILDPSIIETNISLDDPLLSFVRDTIQDHDGRKHSNFYLEHEIVGQRV